MAGAFGWPARAALLAAVAAGMALSAVHGLACIRFRGDQIVSGVAINILALGLTAVIGLHLFQRAGARPMCRLKGASACCSTTRRRVRCRTNADRTAAGGALLRHNTLLTWLAFALVPAVWWLLYRTHFGPAAACGRREPGDGGCRRHLGSRTGWRAVLLAGVLCGIGGAPS